MYDLPPENSMTEANVRQSMQLLIHELHSKRHVKLDSFLMDDGAITRDVEISFSADHSHAYLRRLGRLQIAVVYPHG